MSEAVDLDWCRFEERCRTRTKDGPGFADGRGLCWACEQHGRHAIDELARLYHLVRAEVPKDASRQGIGGPEGGRVKKVDAPIPINEAAEALAREIEWMLIACAVPVWDKVNPTSVTPAYTSSPDRWPPWRSSAYLLRHYQVLRSLSRTLYLPYSADHVDDVQQRDYAEMDGPGAIVALVELEFRASSFVGERRRVDRLDAPCPGKPVGCGLSRVLVRTVGEDVVRCTSCGWQCHDSEYRMYLLTYQPPRLGPCPSCRAPVGSAHADSCEVARCLATGWTRYLCERGHNVSLAGEDHPDPVNCLIGCCLPHDCGSDVWEGVHPGAREARRYGIDLATLRREGQWDPMVCRWVMPRLEEPEAGDD